MMKRALQWAVLVVICLMAPLATAQNKTMTIRGEVKPAQVTRNNAKVKMVYISDRDQGDYLVLRGTDASNDLRKRIGAIVEATGYIKKSQSYPDYKAVIDITEYEIIETEDPAEDPPAEEAPAGN